MKKAIERTLGIFESSSGKTQEYINWHRLFKREFSELLKSYGATDIKVSNPNHFDMYGFFTIDGQAWYFSISDVRWNKTNMFIRTAKNYRDFTGGKNQYISFILGELIFKSELYNILNSNLAK